MEQLCKILKEHALRYPQMQPTDAVKLIYQNEFGGGHMIRDQESCLAYLAAEYARVEKDSAVPMAEDIGNGLVRIHLAAWPKDRVQALGEAFILSANTHKGVLSRFLIKLELLRQLTGQGIFRFSEPELENYLSEYQAAGFPVVSHSPEYRLSYRPAYRVIQKVLLDSVLSGETS